MAAPLRMLLPSVSMAIAGPRLLLFVYRYDYAVGYRPLWVFTESGHPAQIGKSYIPDKMKCMQCGAGGSHLQVRMEAFSVAGNKR